MRQKLSDVIGKKARTSQELRNAYMSVPAGAVVTIDRGHNWSHLTIKGEPCKDCGIRILISRVPFSALELIEETA